tara:strand:- start:7594 stop:8055 length:462 start_codon:yes stop_codon:yes gene_type:complete
VTNIKIRVIDCHIAYKNRNDWQFLMLKRSSNKIYPNIWQGVTGKINNKEQPYRTAIRELFEETGLRPSKIWSIDTVNLFYDSNNNVMNLIPVFGVQVLTKNIKISDEHSEFKWCNINQAIKLLTWEQQKKGIQIFYDMLIEKKDRLKILEINL